MHMILCGPICPLLAVVDVVMCDVTFSMVLQAGCTLCV